MKEIIIIVIFYCIKAIVAQDSCQQYPIPDHVYFDELSSAGSTIFISKRTNTDQQEWSVTSGLPRIALTFVNQTYYIKLLTVIDLDVADPSQTCNSAVETFVERISCARTDGQIPIDKYVTFHVQPVNEYQPVVNTVPDIIISEGNVSLPFFLYRLFDYFKDRDCPKERLVFRISDYSSKEKDAEEYFMINNMTGFLYHNTRFDYEETAIQCGLGKGGAFLNITAEDGLYKISKVLRVMFADVDDSPPVFVNSSCTTTCFTCPVTSLSATVLNSYQGPISSDPPSIKAIDPDTTPSSTVTYKMDVHPSAYTETIKFENGSFSLLRSFAIIARYTEESDFILKVIIQATGSNGQKSNKFIFKICVIVPPIFTSQEVTQRTLSGPTNAITITSQEVTQRTSSGPTKDIVIIVLAVLIVLLFSVIIVCTVYRFRIHKKKSKNNVTSYEDVKQNNVTNENVYATIQIS